MSFPVTVHFRPLHLLQWTAGLINNPIVVRRGKPCDGVYHLVTQRRTRNRGDGTQRLPSKLGRWGKSNRDKPSCVVLAPEAQPLPQSHGYRQYPGAVGAQRGHRIIVPVTGKNRRCETLRRDRGCIVTNDLEWASRRPSPGDLNVR